MDKCNRLWVLDSGVEESLGKLVIRSPPRLIIYNLANDQHVQTIEIPKDAYDVKESKLQNFVVDSNKCDDTYAYIADSGYAKLIVYSHKMNDTWRFKHNFFSMDPEAGDFNISTVNFQSSDALFGLALSDANSTSSADLYFHPMSSNSEFLVPVDLLRNKTGAPELSYKGPKFLGSRGKGMQSGASVFNKNKNVLFYTLLSQNGIGCWQTSRKFDDSKMNNLFTSPDLMYPTEIIIDEADHLWVLSNNFHKFQKEILNANDVNFRILWGSAHEITKNTPCEPDTKQDGKNNSPSLHPIVHVISISLLLSFVQKLI